MKRRWHNCQCQIYQKTKNKKNKKTIDNKKKNWYIKNATWERSKNVLWKLSKTSILSCRDWIINIKLLNVLLRVWSWLRMNAGGMPKTCKSNEVAHWRWSACTDSDLDSHLVAKGWVTRGLSAFESGITVRNDC